MVGSQTKLMLRITHQVLGDGFANFDLSERTLGAIDQGSFFVFLGRLAVFCNHLQVLNVQSIQVLHKL